MRLVKLDLKCTRPEATYPDAIPHTLSPLVIDRVGLQLVPVVPVALAVLVGKTQLTQTLRELPLYLQP